MEDKDLSIHATLVSVFLRVQVNTIFMFLRQIQLILSIRLGQDQHLTTISKVILNFIDECQTYATCAMIIVNYVQTNKRQIVLNVHVIIICSINNLVDVKNNVLWGLLNQAGEDNM